MEWETSARAYLCTLWDVTPRVLRQTYATPPAGRRDLATSRDLLGHANLSTISRYLHPDAARVQEMVEEL